MDAALCLGMDLAWSSGRTGLAIVDARGRLLDSASVRTDDEIAAWVAPHLGSIAVVGVDAPLVVPNATGSRPAERELGRAYGAFGAGAYPANRTLLGGAPRGARLADRFGWAVDPATPVGAGRTVCLEVYPRPALVALFGLPYRLDYKRPPLARRLPGFGALLGHLESVPELALGAGARWREIRATVADPRPGDLDRVEDEVDAVLCAHLAWLWQHRPETLTVYGNATEGYIVAPPRPRHRAVRSTAPLGTAGVRC